MNSAEYSQVKWYEGGMWRGPNVLPGVAQHAAARSSYESSENSEEEGELGGGGRGPPLPDRRRGPLIIGNRLNIRLGVPYVTQSES